jgi:Zn-dependent M28 family amino/carboxypeptidase
VDVPKKDDEGNVIRDETGEEVCEVLLEVDDIHKAILKRNKKHFHQADATPFAGGAENTILYDLIGYTGMSKAAKEVVNGTFLEKYGDDLGDILPETEQVIRELSTPEEIKVLGKKIETEISEADFITGFKGWKECTSTSPLGRHLGHYKAIVNDPDLKKQAPEKSHLRE